MEDVATNITMVTEVDAFPNVTDVPTSNVTRTVHQDALLAKFLLVFSYVQSVVFIMSFLGNWLTITAVVRFAELHKKPTNILIASLAFADSLLGESEFVHQGSRVPRLEGSSSGGRKGKGANLVR